MDYKDLCNLEAEIDRAEWKANTDEAQSVRMWVETHPQNVLHYSEYDGTTDKPFEVVVTTPELVKLMVQHGHKQALLIDSTFGTNSHKVYWRFHLHQLAFAWASWQMKPLLTKLLFGYSTLSSLLVSWMAREIFCQLLGL